MIPLSKSCAQTPFFHNVVNNNTYNNNNNNKKDEKQEEVEEDYYDDDDDCSNKVLTTLISIAGDGNNDGDNNHNRCAILAIVLSMLKKSLVTCCVESDDVTSSFDISCPTEARHVSRVTFDMFNGFIGLPTQLQHQVPKRVPSASVKVFGVSAKSMQCCYDEKGKCCYDEKGNVVPRILLMMQKDLYSEGGLKAEGIFQINGENSQEFLRYQLNNGLIPRGIGVHCLSGMIKAWFRELPIGLLDSLTPEEMMRCNFEEDCANLVRLISSTEVALLDWAINLMADVVQHEQFNKMNAKNIVMVFAPNMTQKADPMTVLIHVVQVMYFLKTLILKTLREKDESDAKDKDSL